MEILYFQFRCIWLLMRRTWSLKRANWPRQAERFRIYTRTRFPTGRYLTRLFNISHQKSWKRILIKYSNRQSSAKQTNFIKYIFVVSSEYMTTTVTKTYILYYCTLNTFNSLTRLAIHFSMCANHFLWREFKRNEYWNLRVVCIKAHTDRTRFGNATRISSFQSRLTDIFPNLWKHINNLNHLVCISCKISFHRRFCLLFKTKNRVALCNRVRSVSAFNYQPAAFSIPRPIVYMQAKFFFKYICSFEKLYI